MKIEDMPFDGELEVFEGHVWSCVVSEKYDNIWIDYNEISDLEFEPWCEMIGEKIVEKCNVESRVSNTIKKSFQKMKMNIFVLKTLTKQLYLRKILIRYRS